MQRPGLKALLADIEAGLVDVIVVYKVDRLTRSLTDFSKLVEVFDSNDVSFVSVTQAFNTTNSMGRLTLNVLLSFAQFEREVTGERIRDKIAMSRKRGLWTGGLPPLGYDTIDKKLVVNLEEANTVRYIYERYAELKNVRKLKNDLTANGYVSKRRTTKTGRATGGKPFERGALYSILKNRTYLGLTLHKGEAFEGQHELIITKTLFEKVQTILASNRRRDKHKETNSLSQFVIDERNKSTFMRLAKRVELKGETKGYRLVIDVARLVQLLEVPANAAFEDPVIDVSLNLQTCNNGKKVIVGNAPALEPMPMPQLINALKLAHQIKEEYLSSSSRSLSEIAKSLGVNKRYVWRFLKLAFLAPDIQLSILSGSQPRGLCVQDVLDGQIDVDWSIQRSMLGFI